MLKAVKVRIFPNKNQELYINKLLGSYRFVYNNCLAIKKEAFIRDKSNLGLKELGNYFHQDLTKNINYQWLGEHNTKVLKQATINLLDAYKRFFINGSGFPKFKSKHDNISSCRFPLEAISRKNDYLNNKLSLTKEIRGLRFSCSKKYSLYLNKHKDNVKSATLTKNRSGQFFLSILIDGSIDKTLPIVTKEVGIDLGIKTFIVTSDGEEFENIKIKRNNEKKLAKLNRRFSKCIKGSKNKSKARVKLARLNQKLQNKKENYLHKVSNKLLNENQVIVIEDLNVTGMSKNHHLARSIQELSLYRFREMLTYKSNWYGRDLIVIDRWFPSSKLCYSCGNKNNNLKLSDRIYHCKSCNHSLDRDLNASLNIKKEGLRIFKTKIPIRNGKLTPLESSQ